MAKPEIAIALYGLFDRLWVKSEGVISKEESRALMEAAQFFQLEANVVAAVEPTPVQYVKPEDLHDKSPDCRACIAVVPAP